MSIHVGSTSVGNTLAVVPETTEPRQTRIKRTTEGDIHVAHIQHTVTKSDLVDGGVITVKQRVQAGGNNNSNGYQDDVGAVCGWDGYGWVKDRKSTRLNSS